MRLATFIQQNKEQILEEWQNFASRLKSAPEQMTLDQLRDHAEGMLDFIVEFLEHGPDGKGGRDRLRALSNLGGGGKTAAAEHGRDRRNWGFSIGDMISEFRALRASVLRLWGDAETRLNRDDLIALGEAIDQALAESIKQYTAQKDRQTHLLQAMLSYSSDQCAIFDKDANILYANRAIAAAHDASNQQLVGEPVETLDPVFAEEARRQVLHVWDTGKEYRDDFTTTDDEGRERSVDYLFAPIFDKHGKVEAVAVTSRDISERRAMEQRLWQHANYDHLTGVPNRRLYFDRLEQDIRLTKRIGGLLAVLYIDLDKFKQANDHLGHEGGDDLLRLVSERIAVCIRETDTLARMGGDEFTVILVRAGDERHVEAVARAIIAKLERPFVIDHETVHIGGSIGIAVYPHAGSDVRELTTHADEAMYAAKAAGGGRYAFYSPRESTPVEREREPAARPRDVRH